MTNELFSPPPRPSPSAPDTTVRGSAELATARRHRLWPVGAVVLLLTVAAGVAFVERARSQAAAERVQALEADRLTHELAMAALRRSSDDQAGNRLARPGEPTEAERRSLHQLLPSYEALASLQGENTSSRAARAEGYFRVGTVHLRLGDLQKAEAAFGSAVALRRQLLAESPAVPENHLALADALLFRGAVLYRLDAQESFETLIEAVHRHYHGALQCDPRPVELHRLYWSNVASMVPILAGLHNQRAALLTAGWLRTFGWEPAEDAYRAGCALAQCVPVVEKDAGIALGERQDLARSYADRAMAMLKDAVAKGWKDADLMKKDTDLDALRQRDDFKKLLAELEARK